MKYKTSQLIMILTIFLSGILSVSAKQCTVEEIGILKKRAEEITVITEMIETDAYYSNLIHLYNLDPSLYLVPVNDPDSHLKSEDETNSITIESYTIDHVITSTFKVYAEDQDCTSEVLRTVEVVIPRFNQYSTLPECQESPDYPLCKKVLYTDESKPFSELKSELLKYKEDKEKNQQQIVKTENKTLVWYIIGGIIIVSGGTYFFVKRRKQFQKRGVL